MKSLMPDTATKILLGLIAAGLWGVLLRPLLAPMAVQAQQSIQPPQPVQFQQAAPAPSAPSSSPPALVVDKNWVYVAADGYLTQFPRDGDGEVAQGGHAFRYPGVLKVK